MKFQRREKESGQVLVILTLGIVVLLGFAALAIDQGSVQIDRRQAQNAADTAALAGALAKYEGGNCMTAATNRAASNGYVDSDEIDVVVDCNYGENGSYVHVSINSTTTTFLASMLGHDTVTNTVEAVALYNSGGGTSSSAFNGSAIIALKPNGNNTFEVSGNATLTTQGGGAFVNSTGDRAFYGNGNLTFNTDTGINIVGGGRILGNVTINSDMKAGSDIDLVGNVNVNGDIVKNTPVTAIPYPPSELEIAAPVVAAPNCSGSGTMSTEGGVVRLTPGTHPARSISGNNNVIFEPGNYCFTDSLSINGNYTVTANNVQFNMSSNKNISLNGNLTFNGGNSLFYLHSGTFILDGNAKIDIPGSTVYIESGDFKINGNMNPKIISSQTSIVYLGSGKLHFNGNSTLNSSNTVFYLNSGSMRWNGNTKLVMDPPDDGAYAGLLIYMPVTNTSDLTINGNSGASLTGSIIAPGAGVNIIGNSGTTTLNSRIIGYTIDISGNSNTTIIFNDDENYDLNLGGAPYIELTK